MSTSSGSERCTALPRMLLLLLLIAITGLLQAQTSSSMANTVVDFDWSLPLAHEDLFYSAWLKPDGTFAVIDSYLVYEGYNFAPDVQQSQPGTWTYIAESATNGRLILAQNGNGGPTLTLSFSTPTTGIVAAQGGAGSFVVRPSLAGSGPANLSSQSTLSAGGSVTSGFVLPGTTSRFVLVRAIGPGLNPFGLTPTAQGAFAQHL